MILHVNRLKSLLEVAGIPVHAVSGSEGNIRIDFNNATTQQQTDAAAIVAAFDWSESAHIAWKNLQDRVTAKNLLDATTAQEKLLRAVADIVKDEINILRAWITDFKADVAAATNLADLKTRVATNADLNPRTLTQLRAAIKNRIDDGTVDN